MCFHTANPIISSPSTWNRKDVHPIVYRPVPFFYLLFLIPRHQRFLSHSGHANHSNLVASRSLSNHSMGRFDRMPFILKRWKGPMSIAVFVTLEEYSSFVNAITPYLGLPITFSVYIPLGLEHSSYFVRETGKQTVFAHTLYPINLLRDLAIESIHTTHSFCVDADFFFSGLFQLRLWVVDTVAKAIGNNMDLLKNDSSLLLFTTYQVSRWSPHFNSCKLRGKKCLTMSHQYPLFTVDGIHYHGIKISSVDVSNGIGFSPSVHSFM